MTESEWLAATDPHPMLESFPELGQASGFGACSCWRVECRTRAGWCPEYRKLRLYSLACCQRIQPHLPHPDCTAGIRTLEGYLEGAVSDDEYDRAVETFDTTRRARFPKSATPDDGAWNALYCAVHRRWRPHFDNNFAERRWELARTVSVDAADSAGSNEAAEQVQLLRCIFGNPFRPVAFAESWRTETAVALAAGIYADRAFDRLPILADALEEAGCDDANVFTHCRGPGPHARGCWVVDGVLGKS